MPGICVYTWTKPVYRSSPGVFFFVTPPSLSPAGLGMKAASRTEPGN